MRLTCDSRGNLTEIRDTSGNLTRITENGQMTQQYVYGALNRLEEAVNRAGKAAKYQYNGLGHRVGKLEGTLSRGQLEGLDPRNGIKAETKIGNLTQIHYTIDLTREYYNLLEKAEEEKRQTYFWDGNVASYEENGRQRYYLQDELGSPIRIEDETGAVRESYGYGAFGEDLYGNQGEMQPFGYTGYQRDKVAGTYYAQAREYHPGLARFVERDIVKGFTEYPFSLNNYSYCYNSPLILVDNNGLFAHLVVGAIVGAIGGGVTQLVSDVFSGKTSSFSTYIGAITGGAAGGAVLAGTGNIALAGAVEGGVTGSVTTLGNGIEDIMNGKRELSLNTAKNILGETFVSGAADAALGTLVGKYFSKFSKFVDNPIKSLKSETVDKVVDSTIGAIKNKVYKALHLTGRNSWQSLTRQVYTKLKNGTWTIKSLSLKTWGKMIGFETIDSAAKESIRKVKEILKNSVDVIDPEELTEDVLNTLSCWSKNLSFETISEMTACPE